MTTTHRTLAFVLAFAVAAAGGASRIGLVEARDAHDAKPAATLSEKSDQRDKDEHRDKGEHRVRNGHADKTDHTERININTADVTQLMSLTGVHKKTAEKIVEYRQSHGKFKAPEDVVKVDGIGHALYEKNRARIVVE
jgi:competence ComEA-like helix-hairpin-helix protein